VMLSVMFMVMLIVMLVVMLRSSRTRRCCTASLRSWGRGGRWAATVTQGR
jgi:hypothetical protein